MLLLAACNFSTPPAPQPSPTPRATALPATPTPLPTVTPQPTATPTLDTLQGQVVFVSYATIADCGWNQANLWAMYPDGSHLRPLTQSGAAAYIPQTSPPTLVFAAGESVRLDTDLLFQIPLPERCYQTVDLLSCSQTRCHNFSFSPSGRYLAFNDGYSDSIDSPLSLLDLQTNRALSITVGTDIVWLSDAQALILEDWFEAPHRTYLYSTLTEEHRYMGIGRQTFWNPQRTAFAQVSLGFMIFNQSVWGYHVATDTMIRPEHNEFGPWVEDQPTWTADGTHLLYTALPLTQTGYLTEFGPRAIYRIGVDGAGEQVLVKDPQFSYFIQGWAGDYLLVRRIPHAPYASDQGWMSDEEGLCTLYDQTRNAVCPEAETFALDWRSGELFASAQLPPPTPTPLPPTPGPDLQTAPIYRAPDGTFALYTGPDGKALWRVPAQGTPIQIVAEGQRFIYIP